MKAGIRIALAAVMISAVTAAEGEPRLAQAQPQNAATRAAAPATTGAASPSAKAIPPAAATAPATTTQNAAGASPAPVGQQSSTRVAPPPAPRVELFSPRGEAKQVRQATARFSVPIVALGDPRLPDPFTVTCGDEPGKGRWADGRNWVYDFEADLPAGIRCTFKLNAGLKALNGQALAGPSTFTFNTGGPSIQSSYPYEGWEQLDEEQVFLLRLDAAATEDSIRKNAWCVIDGLAERVPVDVITGDARTQLLAQRKALGYQYFNLLWKNGARSSARVRDRSIENAEANISAIRCQRRLPNATQVQLVWGAGISTTSGISTRQPQQLAFRVRPAFTAQLTCTRTDPRAGCTPVQPITVTFTSPVPREQALAIRLQVAANDVRSPNVKQEAQAKVVESVTFDAPFPDGASATLELPATLRDDAGRTLENASRFPLAVRIDEYPPLVKFSGEFGILEATEGGVLPVTLRNIDAAAAGQPAMIEGHTFRVPNEPAAILEWLARVEKAAEPRGKYVEGPRPNAPARDANDNDGDGDGRAYHWVEQTGDTSVFASKDKTSALSLRKPEGARPAEVAGIPLGTPGFYVVELESRRLGTALLGHDAVRYVATSALVTNLSIHFEWGRESSVIWVTRLDTGEPVPNAQVVVTGYCSKAELWRGVTDTNGIASVEQSIGEPSSSNYCSSWSPPPVLVTASTTTSAMGSTKISTTTSTTASTAAGTPAGKTTAKGAVAQADFSFMLSSWNRGIEPSSFGVLTGNEGDAAIVHTVLDRPLFRAGETVSMKHFLRRHVKQGITVPADAQGTYSIKITHSGSGQEYLQSVTFGADGIAEQTWKIPTDAKLGYYSIRIERMSDRKSWQSGDFRVEEFRLPTMRASVQGTAQTLVRPRDATLDLHVGYISGGGASNLPVKLHTVVETRPTRHVGYDNFRFGGEPVKEGLQVSEGAWWDVDFEADQPVSSAKSNVIPLSLDAQGAARVTVPNLPTLKEPAVLTAELEYADANGELLSTVSRIQLVPSEVSVGIRPDGWVSSKDLMKFRVVVIDLAGKPVANRPVAVSLYRSASYSYRKRLIGGFYTYESAKENTRIEPACKGKTNAQGLLLCSVAPGVSGEVLVRADASDLKGNAAGATTSIWVAGNDEWWFGGTAADRMDLLPENPEYEAGQTARFQVRMPFRKARALVTVQREGVMRSFVTTLNGREPVVQVPIEATDAPNIYVSVLALRGRVGTKSLWRKTDDDKEVTALVDLNKPAYRLGVAQIRVGWKPHRLDVRVTPDRTTYAIREQAKVDIEVKRADGGALPTGSEIALAAVDEALLELTPNGSWALLDQMMGQRGLEVLTSTAQLQVVGKRHYGRKAVPHGGGGGRDRARESFETLLAWQGRVKLDAQGRAQAVIPLNDSLTSFRIVAVASAGASLFGTGTANIATHQDLILISGLPPVVREGDAYSATFTVRNTGTAALPVELTASITPNAPLAPIRIDIPAGEARDVSWKLKAPVGASSLAWDVSAKHVGGTASDHLKVSERVIPAFPVRTYQATIAQLDAPLEIPAALPKGAVPGRGGLEVTLRARLGDGMDGVREYLSAYHYVCLEQNLSRAVGLRDEHSWNAWVDNLPTYMDRDGLLRYFPNERFDGDDTLTAYVLAIADEASWAIPDPSRTRMISGLTGFVEGRVVRNSALPTADLAIRKLAAISALARYDAARPNMLDSLTIEPNLWPTSAVIDWLGILRRVDGIKQRDERRAEAEGVLRARLNFQGTTMTFSTERTDALWWLMISSDSNAVRALLELMDRPDWRDDVPRLVRGAIGRQQRGHWNTTVANAWGTLAMEKFSAAFESTPVTGTTVLRYGTKAENVDWSSASTTGSTGAAGSTGASGPTDRNGADSSNHANGRNGAPGPTSGAGEGVRESRFAWQAGTLPLTVNHGGTGKPWIIARATAALPLDAPLFTGYRITRTVTPVEQQQPGKWTRGDVARVRLEMDAQSDMSWVVVEDPVPGGATILGGALRGQSELMTRGERDEGWAWPAYEERRFETYRAYYRFVPKGKWVVEYTVRLNNPGTFLLPATHVEAMYAPEMLGELPLQPVVVEAAP